MPDRTEKLRPLNTPERRQLPKIRAMADEIIRVRTTGECWMNPDWYCQRRAGAAFKIVMDSRRS